MKLLKDILYKVTIKSIVGTTSLPIESIVMDSRLVKANTLFVAIKGTQIDGHEFVEQSIEKGATAVICEELPTEAHPGITYVCVEDANQTLALISSNFYDNPSSKIKLVGITGTNGKTTVASLLYQLFTNLGYKVGLLSTVKIVIGQEVYSASHTTPDSLTINYYLNKMVEQGCEYCFMEVSSHGIVQKRVWDLKFQGGVFTNLSHDHLDYHSTFANYRDAKKSFFDHLDSSAFTLTNSDDKNASIMVQNSKAKKYTFALKNIADFKGVVLESQFTGMLMKINQQEVWVQLIGEFNASNLLAVYGCAIALGQDNEEVLVELSKLKSVSGRFQYFISKKNITAIVDYAHTPDALKNVLETINSIRSGNNKLITVVGCGGNRDATKRPIMAQIATELSDRVILTSDNPRFEEPAKILKDMESGVPMQYSMRVISLEDRKQAIKLACQQAQDGDIILIAGKGHETYQEIKGVRTDFNDLEIVTEFLEN